MQVSDIEYHAPLRKSNHCVITFKYHCYLDYSQPEKDVYHKTDFNSMRRPLVLYSCTEKSMIQNHGKLKVACQLIKSFVMLYGTKLSYTGDGYHLKMF